MDFELSPELQAFRAEVRAFFRDNLPPEIARRVAIGVHPPSKDEFRTWQRILYRRGWGAPHWPKRWGGTDWSPIQKHIFMEEMYNFDAIDFGWQTYHMVAPVIIEFGTDAQRERYLAPMLRGDEFWCQGFSEPNAGSDLASLRTRAELDGDHWVVNGQKIWTSDAEMSEWGFFLVRTDATVKPQQGISFLLIEMNTPGITVRPIWSIDGAHVLNEVFLDDVRVPRENIVGEPGKGWTYAKFLLERERTTSAFLYFNKRELDRAREIARLERIDGVPVIETPRFRGKLAELEADVLALEWSVLRILWNEPNKYDINAVVSALKLRGSALQQRVTELQIEALGDKALRFFVDEDVGDDPLWAPHVPGRSKVYLQHRASTIYGGTQEVQKNIIAKVAFDLQR